MRRGVLTRQSMRPRQPIWLITSMLPVSFAIYATRTLSLSRRSWVWGRGAEGLWSLNK